ncbi:MAG: N-(5'-phosphoribosyl)anthranilate isomerase [Bacteroidetes bacterium]|nr:N-(5'-phosphoribosyl)anthranilate isomerase [Bacteroidota bacterium]
MALRTFVKISQVNNLSDARYCAGMGVAMLGFNLEPGTLHYVDPEKFRELSEWVAGVSFAAEFSSASPETIIRLLPEYPVDYLQIDTPEHLPDLQHLNLPLILRIPVQANSRPEELSEIMAANQDLVDFFLLESTNQLGISNHLASKLLSLGTSFKIVADLGFKAEGIQDLLAQYSLKGIALKGGEEIRAGYKDFEELADILEALEVDEAY